MRTPSILTCPASRFAFPSQTFFKPKKVVIHVDRRWGDAEKLKLIEVSGIRQQRDRSCPVSLPR